MLLVFGSCDVFRVLCEFRMSGLFVLFVLLVCVVCLVCCVFRCVFDMFGMCCVFGMSGMCGVLNISVCL